MCMAAASQSLAELPDTSSSPRHQPATASSVANGLPHFASSRRFRSIDSLSSLRFEEVSGNERVQTERFIADSYLRTFNAQVETFMPRLFALNGRGEGVCGALGLRSARGRLFVEHYLSEPIECAIGSIIGERVDRTSIVEVGHFVGAVPGAARALIRLLTLRLHRDGVRWVVFTGTKELRNAFLRLGLDPNPIRAALPCRLPSTTAAAWGTYYTHHPWVYFGLVGSGIAAFGETCEESLA